jgi:hypothetical protein
MTSLLLCQENSLTSSASKDKVTFRPGRVKPAPPGVIPYAPAPDGAAWRQYYSVTGEMPCFSGGKSDWVSRHYMPTPLRTARASYPAYGSRNLLASAFFSFPSLL